MAFSVLARAAEVKRKRRVRSGVILGLLRAARSVDTAPWIRLRVKPKMGPDSGPVPGGRDRSGRRWPLEIRNEIDVMMHCVTGVP
jgi:hypothetical protein